MSVDIRIRNFGVAEMQRWLEEAPDKMRQVVHRTGTRLASEATRHSRNLIEAQMFQGAAVPLSPKYQDSKRQNADKKLIHTGTYIGLIQPNPVSTYGWVSSWDVGVLKGTFVDTKDYGLIANLLEYGNSKGTLPARPLWGEVMYHIETRFEDVVTSEFRRAGLT